MDIGRFRVINASGRMTALGGATLSASVLDAMAGAAGMHLDLERLHAWAGERVAALAGAEAARVVGSGAAGIALSVAAAIAGTDPLRIRALPDLAEGECRIAIQAGHVVDFGAEIAQVIRLGGGVVASVGAVNRVDARDLEALLRTRPAGFVYVQSHHAVQKGMVPLSACVEIAHGCGVPVIVDAAAEHDLQRYVRLGADLVVYSGAKDFEGPTSGIVCGRRTLVDAVSAQSRGIGRAMKVSKEAIVGLVQALEDHRGADRAGRRAEDHAIVGRLVEALRAVSGATAEAVSDDLRPEIERAEIRFPGGDGAARAGRLITHLRAWTPPIWTRDHRGAEGIVAFDPRPLSAAEADVIVDAIRRFARG